MSRPAAQTDRYVSFEGIACDDHARHILVHIRECLAEADRPSPWQAYFETRLVEIERIGQDELFFVGSQVNYIRELFEHHAHATALALLDRIEDECC